MDVEDVSATEDAFPMNEPCTSSSLLGNKAGGTGEVEEEGPLENRKLPFICISEDEFACFDEDCEFYFLPDMECFEKVEFRVRNSENHLLYNNVLQNII